ncbi:MAG: C40 family peptidase [Geodermatophilaceae bacterium]
MATLALFHRSRNPRPILRLLVVICAVLVGLTMAPATATADPGPLPDTASEAARQVSEMQRDLEILSEEQNYARVVLDQHVADAAASSAALAQVNATLDDLDGRLRGVARSAFGGNRLGSFSAILMSSSPQEFLDRVNTLELISARDGALLAEATQARTEAQTLSVAAESAVASAQTSAAEIDVRRAELESQIATFRELYAALSAAEQEVLRAAAEAAAEATAESEPSDDSGTPGPPAAPGNDDDQTPPGPVQAPSDAARIAVETAYAQLGDSYVWGAAGPNSFDCSGLMMYVYKAAGVSLPHSSRAQSTMGRAVSRSELQPGDLVFAYSPVSHVGIYVGGGQVIHASTFGKPVYLGPVDMWGAYNSARRITG